jgi:hypothetical protein
MLDTLPTFSDADLRGLYEDPVKRDAGFGAMTTAKGALPLAALEVEARLDGLIRAGRTARPRFHLPLSPRSRAGPYGTDCPT